MHWADNSLVMCVTPRAQDKNVPGHPSCPSFLLCSAYSPRKEKTNIHIISFITQYIQP